MTSAAQASMGVDLNLSEELKVKQIAQNFKMRLLPFLTDKLRRLKAEIIEGF